MSYIKYSKDERIRYHRKRFLDYLDNCKTEDDFRKNYNGKVQYSHRFIDGYYNHDLKDARLKPAERFGYWRGQRASKKKDTDLW